MLESLYSKDSVYTLDLSLWGFSMCYDELSSFSEHFHRWDLRMHNIQQN